MSDLYGIYESIFDYIDNETKCITRECDDARYVEICIDYVSFIEICKNFVKFSNIADDILTSIVKKFNIKQYLFYKTECPEKTFTNSVSPYLFENITESGLCFRFIFASNYLYSHFSEESDKIIVQRFYIDGDGSYMRNLSDLSFFKQNGVYELSRNNHSGNITAEFLRENCSHLGVDFKIGDEIIKFDRGFETKFLD